MKNRSCLHYLTGFIGAALLFFVGWEYNIPAAAWIAYPLLIWFFRRTDRWYMTLPVLPVMLAARFLSITGGWDMGLFVTAVFSVLVLAPLLVSLFLDRIYARRLKPFFSALVFPCTYIVLDYLLTFMNLGMVFSITYTQSTFLPLIQSASLFGSWFPEFIVLWFAPTAVLASENIKKITAAVRPIAVFAAVLAAVMTFGCFRPVFDRPMSETVRVASVTEPHDRDYWSITDAGTPRDSAVDHKPAMAEIQEALFQSSKRAADFGAKIIFWSEGNCPVYEDDFDVFMIRARTFAKENHVWFMPSVVKLLYGQVKNENIAIMIDPGGEVQYEYEKTISWYPSDSDGGVPVVDTPYGRLSTAICFDMDYPALIHQARNADIMLVPGFDTEKIADYHTRAAFVRGIENGFSTVRQANMGASISADWLGNTRTYQNYFSTGDRIMLSDMPTKGALTLYGITGEVFIWLICAVFLALHIIYFAGRRKLYDKADLHGKMKEKRENNE
ncbi:MAG: hypothetical protein GX847_12465 [Clostridiales bacterium]|nr:hypothetical protein [Clostridiales bacterium]